MTTAAPAIAPAAPAAGIAGKNAALHRQIAEFLVSAGLNRDTVDRALQALDDHAVVPSDIPGAWHVCSSDGEAVYFTGTTFCSCPARAHCYHRVAVIIMVAAEHQP